MRLLVLSFWLFAALLGLSLFTAPVRGFVTPAPVATPYPQLYLPYAARPNMPDLAVIALRIELEGGGSCDYISTQLGVHVEVANLGTLDAGPFFVDLNGVRRNVPAGLAHGQTLTLWFLGAFVWPGENSLVVDPTNRVVERDEGNNRLVQMLPIPTLPPTCTPPATATPTPPATMSATPHATAHATAPVSATLTATATTTTIPEGTTTPSATTTTGTATPEITITLTTTPSATASATETSTPETKETATTVVTTTATVTATASTTPTATTTPVATATATPTPTQAQAQPLHITNLSFSGRDETISIMNQGTQAQSMAGWRLISVVGSQVFNFSAAYSLPAGQTMRLHSGPDAAASGPNDLVWTRSNIWNDSGDKAELRDPENQLVDSYCYLLGCN